ncbi:hypothetical protein EWM64_g2117 [Hericium alpestre]|uniref:Uncharacterized protein n=1 Tax=Hericium alpestre TaxID=135208 RepID=A0A4Z0A4D5_9AGAM|nr:hypothetical protein EWM64_g2117 [Hericium alpestre]
MASITKASLPTLDRLQASVPADLDAQKVAAEWFTALGDAPGILTLLLDSA